MLMRGAWGEIIKQSNPSTFVYSTKQIKRHFLQAKMLSKIIKGGSYTSIIQTGA